MIEQYENKAEHFSAFVQLNSAWITEHFSLEAADHQLFANPQSVVTDGGYILSIAEDNEVFGVCALFPQEAGTYELARMAVSEQHRGRGVGSQLMTFALTKLSALKADKVVLNSNTKLHAAIALYKKHGFETTFTGKHPHYARANICMARQL